MVIITYQVRHIFVISSCQTHAISLNFILVENLWLPSILSSILLFYFPPILSHIEDLLVQVPDILFFLSILSITMILSPFLSFSPSIYLHGNPFTSRLNHFSFLYIICNLIFFLPFISPLTFSIMFYNLSSSLRSLIHIIRDLTWPDSLIH